MESLALVFFLLLGAGLLDWLTTAPSECPVCGRSARIPVYRASCLRCYEPLYLRWLRSLLEKD